MEAVIPLREGTSGYAEHDREKYKWWHLVENFFCSIMRSPPCVRKRLRTDFTAKMNFYRRLCGIRRSDQSFCSPTRDSRLHNLAQAVHITGCARYVKGIRTDRERRGHA
jgi:hypothetical protein